MSQGTISILFGCHNIIHSILTLIAWRRLYRRWPKLWQVVCIFIHDIGHIGLNYLDNYEEKKRHWELGAKIGRKLFGKKAYEFLAGHCTYSGYPLSALYKADKYAHYLAPNWVLYLNTITEPKLMMGMSRKEAVKVFRDKVRRSIESGEYIPTHEIYLEGCYTKRPSR